MYAVYSNKGTLDSNENEQSKATCSNMDKCHKHNVEWKKPDTQ